MTGYQCAACNGAFCWKCDRPIGADVEIKTIASRYCEALQCRETEARSHGLAVPVMVEHRLRWSEGRRGGLLLDISEPCDECRERLTPAALPV